MKTIQSYIQQMDLLKDLPSCYEETIITAAQEMLFSPGETLFMEGEEALGIGLIVQGCVKLVRLTSDGRELVLFIVRAGHVVGEGAVFQKGTHPITAMAMEKTKVLFLPRKLCFELAESSSLFAMRMLSVFALRQRMLTQKLAAQGERNATRRVAGYILHRYFMEGADNQVPFKLSREDMANLLGLARETLSRQLSVLTECGAISIKGRTISIKNETILRSKAKGK